MKKVPPMPDRDREVIDRAFEILQSYLTGPINYISLSLHQDFTTAYVGRDKLSGFHNRMKGPMSRKVEEVLTLAIEQTAKDRANELASLRTKLAALEAQEPAE